MSVTCGACSRELDPGHDACWLCPDCEDPRVLLCPACAPSSKRCPRCGADLSYRETSITKKAFFNPATRGLLGF